MNYYLAVLKKYAEFNGRARRSEYWYFFLFSFLISLVLNLIGTSMHTKIFAGLYSLAVLIPGIAVAVRRMHDVNRSGWYLFIPFYAFILLCRNGSAGPNNYGTDPKDPAYIDEIDQIGNNVN